MDISNTNIKPLLLKALCYLWLIFFSLSTFGQNNIFFEQLSTNDGLSNGTINSIFKDSRGFMWFCTDDGLNRYDGYNIKIYKPQITKNIQAQSIMFLSIEEDSFGRIWVGTSEGLYYLDDKKERIVKFSDVTNIDFTNVPIFREITCLLFDSFQNLWVGSHSGITRIKISNSDIQSLKQEDISIYTSDSNDSLNISNTDIFSIYEDLQHRIWFSSNSNQLDYYSYEKMGFIQQKIEVQGIEDWKYLNNRIKADKKDNFWIATQGFGLIYWDREKQTFEHFKTLPINKDISVIRSIMVDNLNRLWIGTDGEGLVIFDKTKDEVYQYVKNSNDQSNLSSNSIYSIYEDPSGIIWIGTYMMGLNKYVANKFNFGPFYSSPTSETGLSHNFVTGFCEDKNNQIWICTDGGGLNLFDRNNNQFKTYKHNSADPSSISTNATTALLCDWKDNIWIGTYNGGLNRFDQKTQKFYHYWHNPNDSTTISSNHPWGFAQDKWNNLWIATVDAGLNLLKPGTSTFIRYRKDYSKVSEDMICDNSLTYLYIDTNNNLWIGTENGLDRVDLNQVDFSLPKPKLIFEHYKPSEDENSLSFSRISYINEDNLGNLWIGTKGGGLNQLNLKTKKITQYNVNNGLPHDVINGILFDSKNNLWISTNNGLSNFNIEKHTFKNYNSSDGLQSVVFVKTSCLKTSDGMFLFGGINGFNAFYPEKIISKTSDLNPAITDFILFNQTIEVGSFFNERIILPQPISELNEIKLNNTENSFAFVFSALDYSNPEKMNYMYQLKGFDEDWQRTDSKMRIAKYTNIEPGKYTFCVKAFINEENITDSETSVNIIIKPPWWKTLWFKIIAIIAAITFWVVGFTVRVYRLEKAKYKLNQKVEEQTKQLKLNNIQLSESNLMKDKFLSILAHDLISPFNTILGFTELLDSNYHKWDDAKRISIIKVINESSNHLFELLNNLLQWTRAERGLLEYSPEKINLNNSILKIISLLSITAQTKNITIEEEFSDECFQAKSDVQLINAILRNLIGNAIKFTPENGKIIIETKCLSDYIQVSVIDNGVGIEKETLDNLFRIDIQHSTKGTNNEKGTGLGLFLVNEFVIKQQGTLHIESTVGEGSIFSFTVPVWKK